MKLDIRQGLEPLYATGRKYKDYCNKEGEKRRAIRNESLVILSSCRRTQEKLRWYSNTTSSN